MIRWGRYEITFIDRILLTRDSQLCSRPGVSPPLLNRDELSARSLYSIVAGEREACKSIEHRSLAHLFAHRSRSFVISGSLAQSKPGLRREREREG